MVKYLYILGLINVKRMKKKLNLHEIRYFKNNLIYRFVLNIFVDVQKLVFDATVKISSIRITEYTILKKQFQEKFIS